MHVSNIQMIGNGKTIVSIILLKKKRETENTLVLFKNTAFTGNIRNNVFKYQCES